MFLYQKKLQYPVRIKNTNPELAMQIITQYGGPYSKSLHPSFPLQKNQKALHTKDNSKACRAFIIPYSLPRSLHHRPPPFFYHHSFQ